MFADRTEAGQRLAAEVAARAEARPDLADAVVLALPRGGLPVAAPVARALGAPLDLMLVRKIGAPDHPELAVGAVVDGDPPEAVLNDDVLRLTGIDATSLAALRRRAENELARRRAACLGNRARVPLAGRPVIVVDDGIATGATIRAALKGLRAQAPSAIVLAVPVAPPDTIATLAPEADHILCLKRPVPFHAVGAHYRDFREVTDDDVRRILSEMPG